MKTLNELRQERAALIKEAGELDKRAGDGALTETDEKRFSEILSEIDGLGAEIDAREKQESSRARVRALEADLATPEPVQTVTGDAVRADAPAATAGEDRSKEAEVAHHTLQMMRAQTQRRSDIVQQHARALAKLGAYGPELREVGKGDAYNTLYDEDGAILLPTTVRDGIDSIVDQYGVARQISDVFTGVRGHVKLPAATGNLKAVAIAEGGKFVAKKRSFTALELRPKKWGLIVPWTYEAGYELAPRIMQDVQAAIASGFAEAEDDAMFNGDGKGAYHGITGILNLDGVGVHTLGTGSETFSALDTDAAFFVRNRVTPSLRSGGAYVFHPDMEMVLRTLRDGDGRYIYAYDNDTRRNTLAGRPVYYTEALPGLETEDQDDAVFGVYGAFRNWKIAVGQDMTSEELREATVPDADDQSDINLGANDYRALKVREFFDMGTNFPEAFALLKTAAAAGGG